MAQVADEAKSGLDPLFDPVFFLTEEQKELRQQLIEICERDIRPHADSNDRTSTFPRKALESLGPFLGLLLPKRLFFFLSFTKQFEFVVWCSFNFNIVFTKKYFQVIVYLFCSLYCF